MAKTSQLFTVRNATGQFLGTYYAYTAKQAIANHQRGLAAYYSCFRYSTPKNFGPEGLTAYVEVDTWLSMDEIIAKRKAVKGT